MVAVALNICRTRGEFATPCRNRYVRLCFAGVHEVGFIAAGRGQEPGDPTNIDGSCGLSVAGQRGAVPSAHPTVTGCE